MPILVPPDDRRSRASRWVLWAALAGVAAVAALILLPFIRPIYRPLGNGVYFSWVAGMDTFGGPEIPVQPGMSRHEYHTYLGDGFTWGFRSGGFVYFLNWNMPRIPTGPRAKIPYP